MHILSIILSTLRSCCDVWSKINKICKCYTVRKGRELCKFITKKEMPQFFSQINILKIKYANKLKILSDFEKRDVLIQRYGNNTIPQIVWLLPDGNMQVLTSVTNKDLVLGEIDTVKDESRKAALIKANSIIKNILNSKSDDIWTNLFEEIDYFLKSNLKGGE